MPPRPGQAILAAMIYLDNAASTRVDLAVLARMTEVMRADYGNPSAAHPFGAAARRRIAIARAQVLAALGDADGARGDLLWLGMRTSDGVALAATPPAVVAWATAAGLATADDDRLRPTLRGFLFADQLASRLADG